MTAGVANFTGCAITKAGTGYTLTASSNPAHTAPANANAFNITAGAASTIAVSSGSGQSATVGAGFTSPLVALVTDANGNPVSGATVTFTPPGSGASATIGGGNTAVTNASGLATSGTLTANTTAGTYNVTAAATGTNTVNFSETNNPGHGHQADLHHPAHGGPEHPGHRDGHLQRVGGGPRRQRQHRDR